MTAAQIAALQDWINNYPRKVLNWSTSNTVYELYMKQESTVQIAYFLILGVAKKSLLIGALKIPKSVIIRCMQA